MRLTVLVLFLLIGSVGFFACSSDDDSGPEATTPAATTPASGEPTPSASPTSDEPTVTASPAESDGVAALEAKAAEVCPAVLIDPCTESYIATANGSSPAALCVSELAGTWFMEVAGGVFSTPAPGVQLGDPCASTSTHIVVALLNY